MADEELEDIAAMMDEQYELAVDVRRFAVELAFEHVDGDWAEKLSIACAISDFILNGEDEDEDEFDDA